MSLALKLAAALGGVAEPVSLTFVASATGDDTTTITIPASAEAGDLAVLIDCTSNIGTQSSVIPTGWEGFENSESNLSGASYVRINCSFKILESGDPGASVTGLNTSTGSVVKGMLVYRPSQAIGWVYSNAAQVQHTSNDPADITITQPSGSDDYVALGLWRQPLGSITNSFMTPTEDTELFIGATGEIRAKLITDGSSVTVGVDDGGTNYSMGTSIGVAADPYWYFVGVGSDGSGVAPTVPLPSGIQTGDLLIIHASGDGTSMTAPSGWTTIIASATNPRHLICWKIAGSSESAPACGGGHSSTIAVMYAYRGISSSPIHVTGSETTATSSTATAATITTTIRDTLTLRFFACRQNTAATSWTPPTVGTVRYNKAPVNATNVGLLMVERRRIFASATGVQTATINGGSPSNSGIQVAFTPA